MITKKSVSVTEEKRIVVGLIVSTKFCQTIKPLFNLEYFVNSYLKTIASWCDSFFESYQKAPYKHIKDIFNDEFNANRLDETEAELIEKLLTDLDNQYGEEEINFDYWVEMAEEYFRSREIEITINNISVLKEKGNLEAAEKELLNFQKIEFPSEENVLVNPGDLESQEEVYRKRDEEEFNFFQLPGDLGKYLGNQKRGDVVGYFGPAKRGKSFTLINQYKHGVLNRKKTLFFSIEMTTTEVLPRMNQAFFPMTKEEGYYTFPVFDCNHNQTGNCGDRLSQVALNFDDTKKTYMYDPGHTVCTLCKNHPNYEIRKKYKQVTWKESIFRDKDDIFTVRQQYPKFKKMWDRYGRLSTHKKYSLTYDKMMRDIEIFWQKHNWFPDILIIDYIDILQIDSKFDDYRLDDEKWKLLAKIAGETNTLVITATQANKEGHKTESLDSTHQGGFYGKNRHVNLMVGLNQKKEDKADGVMRFGITEARSLEFYPGKECIVLQDFQSGQAYLDSYYPR